MAVFSNRGVFTPDTQQPVVGIADLLAENQKKKKPVAAPVTQAANVFINPQNKLMGEGVGGGGQAEPSGGGGGGSNESNGDNPYVNSGPNGEGGGGASPYYDENGNLIDPNNPPPAPPAADDDDNGLPTMPDLTPETRYVSSDPSSPFYWEAMGYPDASWVGLPIEMGLWQTDENGVRTWIQIKDMRSTAEQLHELRNIETPERPDLIDVVGSEPYTDIQALLDTINDPATAEADRAAAIAQFEEEMGQAPGWYAEQMAAMYGELGGGIMGQEGLTDEYRDAFGRETQLELQQMREDYTRMIEAMSAQGRDVAG